MNRMRDEEKGRRIEDASVRLIVRKQAEKRWTKDRMFGGALLLRRELKLNQIYK